MSSTTHEHGRLPPGARAFRPEELPVLTQAEAIRRLSQTAPFTLRAYIRMAATFLTDPRTSSDAALILADQFREGAREIASRGNTLEGTVIASLTTLANELTEAAPYLPGGAKDARP